MPRVSTRPHKVVASAGSLSNSDEDGANGGAEMSEAARTLFESYMSALGTEEVRDPDDPSDQVFARGMARVNEFLSSSGGDAAVCLICLSSIKPSEAVWSCASSCFAVLHLPCIQEWARNQVDACVLRLMNESEEENRSNPLTAAQARAAAEWGCPKCRQQYPATDMPRTYTCFCGKTEDPEWDPWIAPHTCGELCGKSLTSSTTGTAAKGEEGAALSAESEVGCGHKCLLLCHPGPCPPCPRVVDSSCYCGRRRGKRRCGLQSYSCGRACGALQPCGHPCSAPCHPHGLCPPCEIITDRPCACGQQTMRGACAEGVLHCSRPCGKRLACRNHVCEQVCHSGPCSVCPQQGVRTCPCGKAVHQGLKCTEKAPTCGGTCGKLLPCGKHDCHERCHHGDCSTCRTLVSKPCRCGKMTREVLCGAELLCDRRCTKLRACTRHPCKRRCCDGTSCPPCEERCGRFLKCGNHKCPAPCHSGPCRPCPLTVPFQCACGQGHYSVPCGAESKVIAPRCNGACPVPGLCRHAQQEGTVRHRCHYGPCPPCTLPCGTPLPCGHTCPFPGCHDPPTPPIATFQQPLAPKANLSHTAGGASAPVSAQGPTPSHNGAPPPSKDSNKQSPQTPPPPAIQAAMVAAEVLSACPLWGPPDAQGSRTPQWMSDCPPCSTPVPLRCLGGHEERHVPCSTARPYSCTRPCGRPLNCGNHTCCAPCHSVEGAGNEGAVVQQQWGWGPIGWVRGPDIMRGMPDRACEPCRLPCGRERGCAHPCPLPCHPGPCPPCDVPASAPCHCSKTTITLPCCVMRQQELRVAPLAAAAAAGKPIPPEPSTVDQEQQDLLSCKRPCHHALPFCPHFCVASCHLGPCPQPEGCAAEVTVKCECKRLRAKWPCSRVQEALAAAEAESGEGGGVGAYDATTVLRLLPCGPECPTTIKKQQQQAEQQKQAEQLEKQRSEQQQKGEEQQQATQATPSVPSSSNKKGSKAAAAHTAVPSNPAAAATRAAGGDKKQESSKKAEATPAAGAGVPNTTSSKGSRHLSKAERQALAEQKAREQEHEEQMKHWKNIAIWIMIVLFGLVLGVLGPRLLS